LAFCQKFADKLLLNSLKITQNHSKAGKSRSKMIIPLNCEMRIIQLLHPLTGKTLSNGLTSSQRANHAILGFSTPNFLNSATLYTDQRRNKVITPK
jgi:hypothetical protein